MMGVLWLATLVNCLGIRLASLLNIIGAGLGTIVPGVVLTVLASIWLIHHRPIAIQLSITSLLPTQDWHSLIFFVSVLSSYAGMQVAAFHSQNVANPQRDFPKALAYAVLIILLITILPTLAVALVVPAKHINYTTGLLQGFQSFFAGFQLNALLPIFVGLILLSGFSTLSTWILGPARGLQAAAAQGDFIAWFARVNRHAMPIRILILQACVGSLLSLAFVFLPSINSAFWLLLAATSQLTLLMYLLVFAAAIKLSKQVQLKRGFRIPGGHFGMKCCANLAGLTCLFALVMSFIPPSNLSFNGHYDLDLILINLLVCLCPLGIIIFYINRLAKKQP